MTVDLERVANAASLPLVPRDRIRDVARGIDEVYWRVPHKVHKPEGRLVQRNPIHTLEEILVITGYSVPYTDLWGEAYGHCESSIDRPDTLLMALLALCEHMHAPETEFPVLWTDH